MLAEGESAGSGKTGQLPVRVILTASSFGESLNEGGKMTETAFIVLVIVGGVVIIALKGGKVEAKRNTDGSYEGRVYGPERHEVPPTTQPNPTPTQPPPQNPPTPRPKPQSNGSRKSRKKKKRRR